MMAPEGMSLDNITVLVVSSSDGQILLNQINQDAMQQVRPFAFHCYAFVVVIIHCLIRN